MGCFVKVRLETINQLKTTKTARFMLLFTQGTGRCVRKCGEKIQKIMKKLVTHPLFLVSFCESPRDNNLSCRNNKQSFLATQLNVSLVSGSQVECRVDKTVDAPTG